MRLLQRLAVSQVSLPEAAEQHQVGQYHEEQKVFRQVVDEIQTVIELKIENFILYFRIYMKYTIKCEQKQGVYNGHYD